MQMGQIAELGGGSLGTFAQPQNILLSVLS